METESAQFWGMTPADAPWGDYGRILTHGMSTHSDSEDGSLSLERTGPFIPPITLPGPGDIVVTSVIRTELERQALTGFSFRSVKKMRIPKLDWSGWDVNQNLPPVLPPSGEPEDYVLGRPHDSSAAIELGELSHLVPVEFGSATSETISRRPRRYRFTITSSGTPPDFFRASNMRFVFVSERARKLIASQPVCVCQFHPASLVVDRAPQ